MMDHGLNMEIIEYEKINKSNYYNCNIFIIIAGVIIARTMIGNHFKKKFSKRPPPGIIVKTVEAKKIPKYN